MSSPAYALPERELVLDRYRPLRPLGRGGSGSVWLARDERTGLEVALKIVPREGKRASRAAREMEAASRLRHERCVRAYDFGGDSGHVYIAYEYVQGQTMREALRAGKLDDRDAVEAAAQILDGLAHAHRIGIVHRDVKPSNVLVEDKPAISVRLLDFGLAQFDEADTLTAVGDVPGTLAYIAPERLRGGDATAASDVWAVGVLLWEALAGQHPFWGVPLPQVAGAIESGRAAAHEAPPGTVACPARRDRVGALGGAGPATEGGAARPRPSHGARGAAPRPRAVGPAAAGTGEEAQARPEARRPPPPSRPAGGSSVPRWRRPLPRSVRRCSPSGRPGSCCCSPWRQALQHGARPAPGLAIALFAPVFPLGNVAQAAAVAYTFVALAWLAACWRDARAGLLFVAGPVLASFGGLALLPLAVQPARGPVRKAAQAFAGVMAAALVAGVRGSPLPLTGAAAGDIGIAGSERVSDVANGLATVLQANTPIVTTALALAAAAVALPYARRHGLWGIAALGAGQLALVLLAAPSVPAFSIVAGTWALCGALAALEIRRERYP